MSGSSTTSNGSKKYRSRTEVRFYAPVEHAARLRFNHQDGRVAELDAQIEHLVHAVRPRLLRDRADAYGRSARRHRSFWRDAASVGAAVRSDDRGGHADIENGAADAAALRPDARPEVRHFDGIVRELRRPVSARLLGV